MMRAKTERKVKRWKDQRWLIDSVIAAIGMGVAPRSLLSATSLA
jgi:hypothetical protein